MPEPKGRPTAVHGMDPQAARTLREIAARFGPSLWDEPQRCEALLKDLCPAHEREVFALACAIRQRVPASLLASRSEPLEALLTKLTRRLTQQLPIAEDAARWAVESLTVAVGIAAEGDLQRVRQKAEPPSARPVPPRPVPASPVKPAAGSKPTPSSKPSASLKPAAPRPVSPPATAVPPPAPRRSKVKRAVLALVLVLGLTAALGAFRLPVSLALEARQIHRQLSDDEAWGDLGDLYAATGKYRNAQGCFAVARLLDPADDEWIGKSRGFAETVPIIRQLGIDDDDWVRSLGVTALAQEAPRTAFALFEQALVLDPGDPANAPGTQLREIRRSFQDPAAWVRLGDAFAAAGGARYAAGSYAVARLAGSEGLEDRAPDLTAAVKILLDLGPYQAGWVGSLGSAAYSQGSPAAAKALYSQADSWAGNGSEWGDRVAALETVERLGASPIESRDKADWEELGGAFGTLGDAAKSLASYGVACLLDPDDARLRARPFDLPAAIALLRAANIRNDEWIGDRGDAAARLGRAGEALELYRWALSLDTDDSEWPGKVTLFTDIENLRGRVLRAYSNDELWGDLGDTYARAGLSAQAAACYSVAKLIQPADYEWQLKAPGLSSPSSLLRDLGIRDDEWVGNLGDAARTLGNAQVARSLYSFAHELDPDDYEWGPKAIAWIGLATH